MESTWTGSSPAERMRRIEHPVKPPRPQLLIIVVFGGVLGQVVSLKIKAVLPRIALEKLIDRFFRPGFQTRFQLLPGGELVGVGGQVDHRAMNGVVRFTNDGAELIDGLCGSQAHRGSISAMTLPQENSPQDTKSTKKRLIDYSDFLLISSLCTSCFAGDHFMSNRKSLAS